MVKMAYLIAWVALVVVLAIIGAVVYYQGDVPGLTATASPPPSSDSGLVGSNGTVTALRALSIAESNTNVKTWKAGNKNVSIGQISSDFCTDGLSSTWTITYASDTEEATAHVENMTMAGITVTKSTERLYPVHIVPVDGLIDSAGAFDIASGPRKNVGVRTIGPASAALVFKASGAPIWDINYPLDGGGSYIVRIDASSGSITESATLWR
jgi:hypothetical protein